MNDSALPSDGQPDQPEWHRLPRDPVGFFGLTEGFDRKDLKRAYNTLLRRFKPDKYPQEFQKLRAAFEQLDGELRYGEAPSIKNSPFEDHQWKSSKDAATSPESIGNSNAHQSFEASDSIEDAPVAPHTDPRIDVPREDARETPTHANQDAPIDKPAKPTRVKSLRERLETESLTDLYEELKLNPREPFDFYVLALLSDAVADPKDQLFLHWVLTGLQKFPSHPALTQLLTAYFEKGDVRDDQLATALVCLSQVVKRDRFYFLAEKLFDRLTLSAPWPQVEATLKQCAANIDDHNIGSRVVFTCHLLRRALWLAPIATCQEMLDYINHHYEFLEGRLEYEQELNTLLLNYVQARERFVAKGPIAQMIDHALRRYCLDTDGRGDYEIVKTQVHIAQHPQQLFREFGLTPQEDMQVLFPWIWLSAEVEDRLETQVQPPKPDLLMNATFHMMQQIDLNFPLTPIQFYNLLDRCVPIAVCLMLIIGLPVTCRLLSDSLTPSLTKYVASGSFLLGGVLAAAYWFRFQRDTTGAWMINYLRRLIEKHYKLWWRSLIARFLAATHFAYRDVDRAIDASLERRRSELNICHWLPHFYSRDPALYVYANAVRFLR